MKTRQRLTALVLALFLLLGSAAAIHRPAQAQAPATANELVADLIAYYRDYQEDATTDILRTLDQLKKVDEGQYEAWSKIMDYWSYINTDMKVNIGVTEDGLPQDDSLCIVILGFALNSDGTMKEELIHRLEVGLASAEKYPNAYVVVTGGGTASGNPNVTEGGLMGEWLLEQGLDPDRLIVEDRAPNTVGNAENTFNILTEDYPQVKNIVMVTSDYHVPRGCILFYSKFVLSALESGKEPLAIVSNAGCETGSQGYESISLQASGVASVAGVSVSGTKLPLSQLTGLVIDQDPVYTSGDTVDLTVTARYDSDFARDVSDLVTITDFDPAQGADQTITVSYEENDITISTPFHLQDTHKEVYDNTYLKNLVEEVAAMSTTMYTDASVAKLTQALQAAQAVVAKGADATYEEISGAYEALSQAVEELVKLPNIAYKLDVTANCNQANAYKINDGVKNTSNYWASENNGNVASKDAEIVIDLDGLYQVEYINVFPYWGGQRVYKYELLGSVDGESWFSLGEHTSEEYVTDQGIGHEVNAQVSYLKLHGLETRVEGRPDINNLHIVELEVYGYEANNVAYGKPVTSSGTDTSAGSSSGSSDALINDGDRTTYWDGGVYADRPWVCVDLEGLYQLDGLNVITYWARTDNRYYYYDIYTSVDGENFDLLYSKTEGTDKSTIQGEDIDVSDQAVTARYVKLVGTYDSANASFHLNELRVYGERIPANKTLLQKTYDYAVTLSTDGVTDAAKAAFETALTNAKAVLDKESATQAEVDAAWDALLEGIWGLGLVQGDKSELNLLIARAEGMVENADKYVTDTWQQLVDALAEAKDMLADENAMDSDIQPVVDTLLNAILAQRFKADKSILEDLIGKAENINLEGYTAESVAAFRSALAQAQAVMADETLTEDDQNTVDAAVDKLTAAMDSLTAGGAPEATDKPEASQKPEATQKPENNVPQTGDSASLLPWAAALALSSTAALWVVRRKERS